LLKPWSEICSIKPMERSDIDAVAAIEHAEPSAWSTSLIAAEFNCDYSMLLAARINGCVVGWCCARVIGGEAELLKIGVARTHRLQSVGTSLVSALLKTLKKSGVETLLLEVRSKNGAALSFYQWLGFTPAGRRISYYSQPDDDALILQKTLSPT
jgi:ribosomal-protein-alanine N-acetyltransferase